MVLDVVVAFGPANAAVVRRWIQTIFALQPKYKTDMIEALKGIGKTFDVIKSNVHKNEDRTLRDLALFALDCAFTLHTLVVVLPETVEMCTELHIERMVTAFYDEALPFLSKNIAVVDRSSESMKFVDLARIEMIEFFREVIKSHLEDVLNQP